MTDLIESAEAFDLDEMFNGAVEAQMSELPEGYYADPDDDPLDHLNPSRKYVKFDGSDGTFYDDGEDMGRELRCVIIDIARTRDLWTPNEPSDKLYEEIASFPSGRPVCRNSDVGNKMPRFSNDLTPDQVQQLKELGAGDCEDCPLIKKGCRGGRKLLLFNPKWEEPVVLQVSGTSIGGLNEMLRRDFKHKGRSLGVFTRAVRLFAEKKEKDGGSGKKISYYQMRGEATGFLKPQQIDMFLGLRDAYRLRSEDSDNNLLPSSASSPAGDREEDQGRLV